MEVHSEEHVRILRKRERKLEKKIFVGCGVWAGAQALDLYGATLTTSMFLQLLVALPLIAVTIYLLKTLFVDLRVATEKRSEAESKLWNEARHQTY